MAFGLVIINKEFGGEEWSNTHAFDTGGIPGLGDDDLQLVGMPALLADPDAATGGTGYDPQTAAFVPAIIAFERFMTHNLINFTSVYVSDGKISTLGDPNTFAVASFFLAGKGFPGFDNATDIVPGNVALQVNRVPSGYSARQGRMFMRGALLDTDVRFNGRGGLAYTNPSVAAAVVARLAAAVTASGLERFYGGTPEETKYCIPQYSLTASAGVQRVGQLIGCTPIGGLVALGPVSRQMKRGKKRAA